MKLQTPVALPSQPEPRLGYQMGLMSIGSCFGEHIGRRLESEGFRIDINPFGIQYNPLSMARGLRRLLSVQPYGADELVERDGLYHSFDHHSTFSAPSPEAALERINRRLGHSGACLRSARYLIVTWGTAYVYALSETGRVVSNCHKLPERAFVRRRCHLDELVAEWRALLEEVFDCNPDLRVVQTVSPIRYLRDGAHASQISKATLLLLCEELCSIFPDRVSYFPAYELVLDELRDYRFYAEDMVHPSEQAVRYVGDRFIDWAVTQESKALMPHLGRLRREYLHRPLGDDTPESLMRREQLLVRIRAFAAQYPEVCLSSWLNPADL